MTKCMTIEIERRGDDIWLCLSDGRQSVAVARFSSENAASQFIEALDLTRMVAHAAGASGI